MNSGQSTEESPKLRVLRPIIDVSQVKTVATNSVPSHKRTLTEAERREAFSQIVATTIMLNGIDGVRQKIESSSPIAIRAQIMQPASDVELVSFFVYTMFYDELSYETLLRNWVKPDKVRPEVLSRFMMKLWHGNFQLRLDNSFVYFFSHEETLFCVPRGNLQSVLGIEALAELVRRYHLWEMGLVPDQTYATLDSFAYNPVFRAMMDRSMLAARFVKYYLTNNCNRKRKEQLHTGMLNIQRLAATGQLEYPLTTRERAALKDITDVLGAQVIDATKLSRYTHPSDDPNTPEPMSV